MIHLTAQLLVLRLFKMPSETFETNSRGTTNLLMVANEFSSVNSMITAEAARGAWRRILRQIGFLRITVVRGINTIGGVDSFHVQIFLDANRAFSKFESLVARNPYCDRPWQHVLDPLLGSLEVLSGSQQGEGFDHMEVNFHPNEYGLSVREALEIVEMSCPMATVIYLQDVGSITKNKSEILNLDLSFTEQESGWIPKWRQEEQGISSLLWWRDHPLRDVDAKTLCKKNKDELNEA